MHNRHRVGGIGLSAALVAEDPEGQYRGAYGPELANQLLQHRSVRVQVIGVELDRVHGRSTGRAHRCDLAGESVGAAGGQHHRRSRGKPGREFDSDIAAAAENHDDAIGRVGRVIHGCDYSLR